MIARFCCDQIIISIVYNSVLFDWLKLWEWHMPWGIGLRIKFACPGVPNSACYKLIAYSSAHSSAQLNLGGWALTCLKILWE